MRKFNVLVENGPEEIEIPDDIIENMTLEHVHFSYCIENAKEIILNSNDIIVTPEQFEDLYSTYFGVYGLDLQPIPELSPMGLPKDNEERAMRLQSFSMVLGDLATRLFPVEKFQSEVLKNTDVIEYGLNQSIAMMLKPKSVSEAHNELADFYKKLCQKHFNRKSNGTNSI